MKDNVKERCDLLVRNKNLIHKAFTCEHDLLEVSAALIFTGKNMEADIERLKECKKILKSNVSAFSGIRDLGSILTVSKMATSNAPEMYLEDLQKVYKILKKGRPFESSYVVLAASNVIECGKVNEIEALAKRFNEIDKRMNKEHPILTDGEDLSFAMLLAMSGKDTESIINDMENCYKYMRSLKVNAAPNGIHGLSQVLTLMGGDMKNKCDKAAEILKKFKEHGTRYGKEAELPAIGALVDIDADADTLVTEVIEAADYLKQHKGFGSMHMDKAGRLMFAALLIAEAYEKDGNLNGIAPLIEKSILNSCLSTAIAAEVAIMMVIVIAATSASH